MTVKKQPKRMTLNRRIKIVESVLEDLWDNATDAERIVIADQVTKMGVSMVLFDVDPDVSQKDILLLTDGAPIKRLLSAIGTHANALRTHPDHIIESLIVKLDPNTPIILN